MGSTIRLALATIALAVGGAPPALAATTIEAAPGRIIFPVANGRARLASAIALPTGGALLVGVVGGSGRVYLAKVAQSGALDPSFGVGGIAVVDAELAFEQILLQPDGQIVLVGMRSRRGHFAELGWGERHGYLVALRLNPDGSIDREYGTNGTAETTLEGGCYCGEIALEEEGGKLVVTGQQAVSSREHAGSRDGYSWALARLDPSGSLDPSFGDRGVALVAGEEGVGLSIAPSADGTIIAQGQTRVTKGDVSGPENLMTRLTIDGAPDRSYLGGIPFALPVFSLDDSYGQTPSPLEALAEPDGRVVVETFPVPANLGQPKRELGVGLIAFDGSGRVDRAFGYGGYLNLEERAEPLGSELVPGPAGEIVAIHQRGSTRPSDNTQAVPGIIEFERITSAGLLDQGLAKPPGIAVDVPFGGGLAEPGPLSPDSYPEAHFTLEQNTFLGTDTAPVPVPQPDGSYLLAGTVTLTAPAAPHAPAVGISRFALAALTPSLALDDTFGGPAHPPTATIITPPQTSHADLAHRRVLVEARMSEPGIAEVLLSTHGRLLTHKLIALLGTGETPVAVPLSRTAERYLRSHRRPPLQATLEVRNMLAEGASASTALTLR